MAKKDLVLTRRSLRKESGRQSEKRHYCFRPS